MELVPAGVLAGMTGCAGVHMPAVAMGYYGQSLCHYVLRHAVLCCPPAGILQLRHQRGLRVLHHDQPQRAALQVRWQSWGRAAAACS
jgi:hypothetical protein